MRIFRHSLAFAATLFVIALLPARSQSAPKQKEQKHFSAEDDSVNNPVVIPADALALLAKDDRVRNVLEDQKIAPADLPSSWFSAAEVKLGSKGEKDLIVMAEGPLRGANINPFWIFIHDGNGFKLALSVSLHDLAVKRTHSHGYRDLESSGMAASTFSIARFRFDGNEYKESSEKTTEIK